MLRRELGSTGMEVTCLGYGSMGIRGPNTWGVRVASDQVTDQILNAVLDAGINFIDTAPDYGISEERIGRFISSRREEFFLATKCGCAYVQHPDHIEINHTWEREVVDRNLELSLLRLRTDVIDLMQFHGGDAATLESRGLIDQLVSFKEQGVIRCLGASSSLPNLPDLIKLGVFDTFQIPYSCLAPVHHDWIAKAAESGAGIIIRGGIAHGGPDAEIQRDQLNHVWESAGMDEIVPGGMSRAEFILRYTLSHPNCGTVIVGTCNLDHLNENIEAAKRGPLAEDVCAEVSRRVAQVIP